MGFQKSPYITSKFSMMRMRLEPSANSVQVTASDHITQMRNLITLADQAFPRSFPTGLTSIKERRRKVSEISSHTLCLDGSSSETFIHPCRYVLGRDGGSRFAASCCPCSRRQAPPLGSSPLFSCWVLLSWSKMQRYDATRENLVFVKGWNVVSSIPCNVRRRRQAYCNTLYSLD